MSFVLYKHAINVTDKKVTEKLSKKLYIQSKWYNSLLPVKNMKATLTLMFFVCFYVTGVNFM